MARYAGKKGRILMSTTGSGTASAVASMASWTLDASTDLIEVTSFGDANKTYVQSFPDVSGNLSGHWDDTDTTIQTGRSSADGVKIYLYPDFTNAPTKYAYGTAFVDFSIDATAKDAVKVSAKFAARGDWDLSRL